MAWLVVLGPGASASPGYQRSVAQYTPPDVALVDHQGRSVRLRELLAGDRPTFVQFVFTSCPTICPILGATFANFQARLGTEAEQVRFVSVSIDPEHDGPATMQAFLQRYHAQENWTFVTGGREAIRATQRAFDAYADDKMSHTPLTFFYSPSSKAWIRIGGFIGAADLVAEYRAVEK